MFKTRKFIHEYCSKKRAAGEYDKQASYRITPEEYSQKASAYLHACACGVPPRYAEDSGTYESYRVKHKIFLFEEKWLRKNYPVALKHHEAEKDGDSTHPKLGKFNWLHGAWAATILYLGAVFFVFALFAMDTWIRPKDREFPWFFDVAVLLVTLLLCGITIVTLASPWRLIYSMVRNRIEVGEARRIASQ